MNPNPELKSSPITMNIGDIPKLKLEYNQKTPIQQKWFNGTNKKLIPCDDFNVGIICNKHSGVCGVDLDFYSKGDKIYDPINNKDHKLFIDTFGTDFIKDFNTYTQKTPSGGFHLIFQHHNDFQQKSNTKESKRFHIDTRGGNTNGQCVLAGSIFKGNKYEVINDTSIKPIPGKLLEFLKTNLFVGKSKPIRKSNIHFNEVAYQYRYKYNVPEQHLEIILNKLDDEYFTDRIKWITFTAAMKQINHKTIWDKYSKKRGGDTYNKINNFNEWDKIVLKDNKFEKSFYFETILKAVQQEKDIKFYRYLSLPKSKYNNKFSHINVDYLSNKLDLSKTSKFVCIKSDTGTGKTTLVKQLIKEHQHDFISITSRTCLAYEQFVDFRNICVGGVDFYQNGLFNDGIQGATTCIDSLLKIKEWDFTDRVIFLDEFNSVIEYMLSCDTKTLSENREDIYELLMNKILMEAKMIICVDADISDLSIEYLVNLERTRNIKFDFIQNDYLHNKNTKATEIFEHQDFIHKVQKENLWLMPCDSKTTAKALHKELTAIDKELYPGREPILLIIAEDKNDSEAFVRLNEHKRIIFSPKIVYGLDSNGYGEDSKTSLSRPVFAYYNMKSISPSAMGQQINRERKITHLYFLIYNKTLRNDIINDEEEFKLEVQDKNNLSLKLFKQSSNENNVLFCKLLYMYSYKQNCYKSNVYLHFIKMLKNKGWDITNDGLKCGIRTKAMNEKTKQLVVEYNEENYSLQDHLQSRLNEKLFKFKTVEELEPYREYFTDDKKVKQHLGLVNLLHTNYETLQTKLETSNDFTLCKISNSKSKHLFIKSVIENFGYDTNFNKIKESVDFDSCGVLKQYRAIWIDRSNKPIELKTEYDKIKFIAGLYQKMNIPMDKPRIKNAEGEREIKYKLNNDAVEQCNKLFNIHKYNQPELQFLD
jgi:hypothetical protein